MGALFDTMDGKARSVHGYSKQPNSCIIMHFFSTLSPTLRSLQHVFYRKSFGGKHPFLRSLIHAAILKEEEPETRNSLPQVSKIQKSNPEPASCRNSEIRRTRKKAVNRKRASGCLSNIPQQNIVFVTEFCYNAQ